MIIPFCSSFVLPFKLGVTSAILSAVIVFKTVLGKEADTLDPSILNSNLFPVKATGEVLFLSVASFGIYGRPAIFPRSFLSFLPEHSDSIMSSTKSPRKIEMIAGGASLTPRRKSLPGLAAEILKSSG